MQDFESRKTHRLRLVADVAMAVCLVGAIAAVYFADTRFGDRETAGRETAGRPTLVDGTPAIVQPGVPGPGGNLPDVKRDLAEVEAPAVIGEFDELPVDGRPSGPAKLQPTQGGDKFVASTRPPAPDAIVRRDASADAAKASGADGTKAAKKPEPGRGVATNPPTAAPAGVTTAQPQVRALAARNGLDDAVDRFIAYDIGQLPGVPGIQARDDFNRLGPEAIEALIRGLNQSATISASCPVIVLQNKLSTCLAQSRDPAAFELAIQHLGEGVPTTAPHCSRLINYRNQLIGQLPENHPARVRAERAQRLVQARDDSAIYAALKSPDADERRAAANAAATMGARFGKQLIQSLADPNAEVRQEARQGLVRMGTNADFGPEELATAAASAAAIAQWDKWWDAQLRSNIPAVLWRASPATLRGHLKNPDSRHRYAAVVVVRSKKYRLFTELIGLLRDPDPLVRREAHQTLVELAKGENYGPADLTNEEEVATAISAWNRWGDRQKMLLRYSSLSTPQIISELKNSKPEQRWAAVSTARRRRVRVIDDLIRLLNDESLEIRQEARHALIHFAGGSDFGPSETANEEQRGDAVAHWKKWSLDQPKAETPPLNADAKGTDSD